MKKAEEFYILGKKEASYTWYFENGQKAEIGFYKNGLNDGKLYTFYENGVMKREAEYKKGELIREVFYDTLGFELQNK